MSKEFWEWFDKQRDGIPVREVERRGGAPHGRISNAYHRKKEPSAMVCETIAEGLGLDPIEVMRRAGVIQSSPAPADHPNLEIMLQDIWQAWKKGTLINPTNQPAIRETPSTHDLPAIPATPEDEHIMELFELLDSFRQRLVYDFTRWQLREQLNPTNSSGARRDRQADQETIGLIDFMSAVERATPEEREQFSRYLLARLRRQEGHE